MLACVLLCWPSVQPGERELTGQLILSVVSSGVVCELFCQNIIEILQSQPTPQPLAFIITTNSFLSTKTVWGRDRFSPKNTFLREREPPGSKRLRWLSHRNDKLRYRKLDLATDSNHHKPPTSPTQTVLDPANDNILSQTLTFADILTAWPGLPTFYMSSSVNISKKYFNKNQALG